MVRTDGTHITVQVGADFQVTNVLAGQAGAGQGGAGQGAHQPPAGGASTGQTPPASGSTASS